MGVTDYGIDGEVVARLLAAALLGGVIGVEREVSGQPAGLRTHIAVAVGAAMFGIVSTLGFVEFDRDRATTTLQADVTRVASNVAVGIGFLGAGVIWRQGSSIRNLTTAASLWTVAAIGLAAGVGDVATAALGATALLVSLVVLRPIRSLIEGRASTATHDLRVVLRDGAPSAPVVEAVERAGEVELEHIQLDTEEDRTILSLRVHGSREDARQLMGDLAALAEVRSVAED